MKIKTENRIRILLTIFFLLICLQQLTIVKFEGFSLKAYHLYSLIFLIPLLKKRKIKVPNKYILIFIIYAIAMSLIAYLKYGFNSLILNYIFGLYVMIIVCNIGENLTKNDWLKLLRNVATIMAFLVIVRFIYYHNEIIDFLSQASLNGHPDYIIGTYFGGGANLEASWIALLGFSFYQNKYKYVYFVVSVLTSIVYVSRAGIVLNVILFIWLMFQKRDNGTYKSNLKSKIITIFVLGCVGLVILYKLGLLDYILTRMLSTGDSNDNGLNGRLNMWMYVFSAFKNNPLGYGLGNALTGIELAAGMSYPDHNVHNVYFQMFLDCGFIGGLYYILLIGSFFLKNIKKFFTNPFVAFLISYFILGLIQFRGGDVIAFFVLGIYFSLFNKEKIEMKESNK